MANLPPFPKRPVHTLGTPRLLGGAFLLVIDELF
jgi:hypothetical protein